VISVCLACQEEADRRREVTTWRWESEKRNSSAAQNYRKVGRWGKKTKHIANL